MIAEVPSGVMPMTPVTRARTLRRHATWAEREVWNWLRHRHLGGYKFRRQHPLDRYVLDFYCPELELCIEVDGDVHDHPSQQIRDDLRSCELSKHGITVLRIRNEEVRYDSFMAWEAIVGAVIRAVRERTGESERDVTVRMFRDEKRA